MKVLYLKGTASDADAATTEQLLSQVPQLELTTVDSAAEALTSLRSGKGAQALIVSPGLPQNETLALVTTLRRDRVPIAIIPVVDETRQELFASAIASGADDVLMMRGQALVNVTETLTRIRQSPHLFPDEQRRRIQVLYVGRDTLVWNLLEQIPFIKAERTTCGVDGGCPVRTPGSVSNSLRCDVVVIDEQPGEAHPLQVLKSVKAQASDLAVVVLTSTGSSDIATAALELGADDTVLKSGIFRRRLVATLRRVHQRLEASVQNAAIRDREARLRQIVENVPSGITVIGSDGAILAMNLAGLRLFGATRPREVVGRDFRSLVLAEQRDDFAMVLHRIIKGESAGLEFDAVHVTPTQASPGKVLLRGVVLERDAKGGRGMVAAVTPSIEPTGTPATDADVAAELEVLKVALQEAEQQHAAFEQRIAEERETWTATRLELEAQSRTAEETHAHELETLKAALQHAEQEHSAFEQRVADERLAWTTTRADLEAQAQSGQDTQAAELEAVKAALQQAEHAHAAFEQRVLDERQAWNATRADLEQHLSGTQAKTVEELDALGAALQRALGEHAAFEQRVLEERQSWATTRAELEAQALTAHTAKAAELEAVRAALAAAEQAHAAFEQRVAAERQTAAAEREAAEAKARAAYEAQAQELQRVKTALSDAEQAHVAFEQQVAEERQTWTTTRAELEAQAHTAYEAKVHELDRAKAALADADQAHAAFEQRVAEERHAWAATRADLERHLGGTRAQTAQEVEALKSALLGAEQEHAAFEQRVTAERHTWTSSRADLEKKASDTERALGEELQALRTALEQQRRQHTILQQRLTDQQLSWAEARADLEQKARDAHETANGHNSFRAQLLDATTLLEEETASHAATKASLEAKELEFEALVEATRAAASVRAEAQEALRAAHDALADGLARERSEWQAARRDFEARLEATETRAAEQPDVARLLELSEEFDKARQTFENDRHAWEAAERQLQGELQEARDAAALLASRSADAARLAAELRTAELRTAEETLAGERVAWQQATMRLETELARTRSAIATHQHDAATAVTAAAALEGELGRLRQAAAAAQTSFEATTGELVAELERTKAIVTTQATKLSNAAAVGAELGQVQERLAVERADWMLTKERLLAQLEEAQSTIAGLEPRLREVSTLERSLQQGEERWTADRSAWQASQQHLEAELQRAQRQATRTEDQQIITALRAEIREVSLALADERAAWQGAREALQAELRSAEQAAADRQDLQRMLDAAHVTLRQVEAQHLVSSSAWDRARQDLEAQVRDMATQHAQDQQGWAQLRLALDGRVRDIETLARDAQQRHQLLDTLRAEHDAAVRALHEERAAHVGHLRDAELLRSTAEAERDRRVELERALADAGRQAEQHLHVMREEHARLRRTLDEQVAQLTARAQQAQHEADTLRQQAQSERSREAGPRRIIESDLLGYAIMTLEGRVVRCNNKFARIFGYADAADLTARQGEGVFLPMANRLALDRRLVEERQIGRIESCLESVDGRPVHLLESATIITEQHGGRPVAERLLIDIGREPSREDARAQRLEEIGALSTAMMPEIETLVASMTARTVELRSQHHLGAAHADAEALARLSDHLAALVRQVSAFSRRQVRQAEPIDVAEAVERAEPILKQLAGSYLSFSVRAARSDALSVSREDLDQLLTSLVVFGRDLLPAGGTLVLETRRVLGETSGTVDSADPFSGAGTLLSLSATGYGVQITNSSPTLQHLATRCGGALRLGGEPGWMMRVDVQFPRCPRPARGAWNWLVDSL